MPEAENRRAKSRLHYRDPRIVLAKTIIAVAASTALDASFTQMLFAMLGADAVMLAIAVRHRGKGGKRANDSNQQK